MKLLLKLSIQFMLLSLLISCADGDFFAPKKPPLAGKRLNVLHYDLLKDKTLTKEEILIPHQFPLNSWEISDVGQYSGLPSNIKLGKNPLFKKSFNIVENFDSTSGSSITIVDDIIYSYTRGILSAYKMPLKKTIWSVKAISSKEKDDIIGGSIAHSGDVIYLSSGTRDLVAFNAYNGKELWRYTAPNVVRYIPVIYNGRIYLSSTDNTIFCLDLEGNLIWRFDAPIYSLITSRIYLPNVVYKDKIINITTAGDLIALNRHDGMELAEVNLATAAVIGDGSLAKGPIASPVLKGDYLYILTGESELLKINLANPQILWRQNFPGARSIWISDNAAYIITDDNQLFAIDNNNGEMVWIIDLNKDLHKKDVAEFYGPVLAGDQLIITEKEGDVYFLSPKDGSKISHFKNKSSTNQMPIIVNEKAYFIGKNGNISIWQ